MASTTLTHSGCGQQSTPDVVIGVDTHKDLHVAVALAPNGGRLGDCRIATTRRGYDELIAWSEQFGYAPVFAVEGTGSFGAGLCRELLDAGFEVVEVNRPDRSTRRRLGKDDAIDAEAAARSWIAGSATVTPKAGDQKVEMIRLLKVAKDSATESRTRAINQIKAIVLTAPAALREQLEPLQRTALIRACAALRPGLMAAPLAAAKRALRLLARRVQALDLELRALQDDLDVLTQAVCPGLRQTYGVGVDAAAILLTTVGDNPQRLRSEGAFAALCGVSPLPASSGKTNRHRLNRGGNRQANAALHRIAVVRLRWHEQSRAYASRRSGEELSKAEILRCLKRFIAREIFHTLLGRPPLRTSAT
jgi:transposase